MGKTVDSVYEALVSTGVPVTYFAFPEKQAPPLPFICYFVTGTDNFVADGRVYLKVSEVSVELYTKEKDFALEETLENALSDYVWQKEGEDRIPEEKCYVNVYTLNV